MKAVVFHGVGDVRLDDVREPMIASATDAVVRLTASAICGTDFQIARGIMPDTEPGTILGHEGIGIVEDVGDDVRNFESGDRVVIASTIACGNCTYCREGLFAQCDRANPNGPDAGVAFYGGPRRSGPFQGLQAELARVPYAHTGMVKLPDEISDEQAILLSDIFPTGYFGAEMANVQPGCSVAVFGCGPVGQFAIAAAKMLGAARIFAIDTLTERLELAKRQGAEVIDFEEEDPVETLMRLTGGTGVGRAIDALCAENEHGGSNGSFAAVSARRRKRFEAEMRQIAPEMSAGDRERWHDGPSQALEWAVESLAKAGTLAVIGMCPNMARFFPLGLAMDKNVTLRIGSCNHRRYIPMLIEKILSGAIDPVNVLHRSEVVLPALEVMGAFARREPEWTTIDLRPSL